MKRYTGQLIASTKELIKQNEAIIKAKFKAGMNAPKGNLITFDESIKRYNKGISTDEIKAWVWYRRMSGIPMKKWKKYFIDGTLKELHNLVKSGALFIENGKYVPLSVFLFGNIHSKLSKLKDEKDFIIKNFGQSIYDNHEKVLLENKPKQLSILNPIENERPVILAISKFARNFKIKKLKENTGVILEQPETLQDAYKDYLRALPDEIYKRKTNALQIINYYLNGGAKPRSIDDPAEWRKIKKYSQEYGEKLFKKFLHEALTYEDQLKIDAHWNMNYNAVTGIQHHKIPVGVEISRYFHGFELDIRPAQREAMAFMEMVGSGIIAYDVGVGKTISAILELASAIQNGKAKRPLVVVPNPTYKNWIKEMFGYGDKKGILSGTNITLNEWYNLGAEIEASINLNVPVPENSITLVTYEGMAKIGFKETDKLIVELGRILDQSTKADMSDRDFEKKMEKYRELVGIGNKGTIADIEILSFDYLVIDEAHNFKNVFSEVKSDDDDEKKRFHIKGGKPSSRGIKAFFIANYIQRNFGRNVMLLTATPFTNSPLEIYSMLSLVAYDYMKTWGILNIKDFFEQYILETQEYVVNYDGEIKQKAVVKSFNNRISLQKLINSHINFKTGEEVNIPRPCKVNLPKTTEITDKGIKRLPRNKQIVTYLELNDEQEMHQHAINNEMKGGADKDDPGKILRLMNASLNNALSPFLYNYSEPKDYKDFVDNSPKIKYTMDAIKSVKQWYEKRNTDVTGKIIYIDRGKQFFHYIKEYLEKELHYQKGKSLISNPRQKVDEVEIITGGISQTKKEKIKTAFNEGVCKIIIGTSTIKEGINLQKKSTVLYNLYPNWNPTDIRQLEGRIWRQKNENGYVRIVMPLMENSMDVFIFQKLEEKTSRINDLWSKADRGNVLDEEGLDPNEVKFALVTDLTVLARHEINLDKDQVNEDMTVLEANIKALEEYGTLQYNHTKQRERLEERYKNGINNLSYVKLFSRGQWDDVYFKDIDSVKKSELNKTQKERLEKTLKAIDEVLAFDYKAASDIELIQYTKKLDRLKGEHYNWALDTFKETVSKYQKIRRSIFEQRGYDENTDLSVIKDEMAKELEALVNKKEILKSPEYFEQTIQRIAEKKEKMNIEGGSLTKRVKDFTKLNHLLSYKFKDVDISTCKIPSKENPNFTKENTPNNRNLQLAKAKMKMAKAKLKLLAL